MGAGSSRLKRDMKPSLIMLHTCRIDMPVWV